MAEFPLYLFAKTPIPGSVKTRMQSDLSSAVCAQLAAHMCRQSVRKAQKAWPGKLVLCVTPSIEHPVFDQIVEETQCEIELQRGEDLGQRMYNAMSTGIACYGGAAVMGCDAPHVSEESLGFAWRVICSGGSVIGPAEDGGFYFLGASNLPKSLFNDVTWGGSCVLNDVLSNAESFNIEFEKLRLLRDIDRISDLVWISQFDQTYTQFTKLLNHR